MPRGTRSPVRSNGRLTVDQHKANVLKKARKRDAKDVHAFAAELGVSRQALARPLAQLVREGLLTRVEQKGHRPALYTKS